LQAKTPLFRGGQFWSLFETVFRKDRYHKGRQPCPTPIKLADGWVKNRAGAKVPGFRL